MLDLLSFSGFFLKAYFLLRSSVLVISHILSQINTERVQAWIRVEPGSSAAELLVY